MSHRLRLTRRCLFSLPLAAAAQTPSPAPTPAAATAAALKELAFDPKRCWRVRDLTLVREDLKLYLTDGYIILSKPLAAPSEPATVAALFWADIEGGDGELLLLPPTAGERQSLARFTNSPNLNEHFKSALLVFTDGTAAEIEEAVRDTAAKPGEEMGALLADQFSPTVRNLTASFEARVTQDVAGRVHPRHGLFFAAFTGTAHGNFDVIYDPQSSEQIVAAQLQNRENRSYYNVWSSFPSRRVRKDPAEAPPVREFDIVDVKIDAVLSPELLLSCTTSLRIRFPEAAGGVRRERNTLAFDISRRVRVREALVDGRPAQVLQRENLRSTLLRGNENEVFLVALPESLAAGDHTITFRHEGEVILPAGNGVYFVSARGTWYPHHGLQFANYEMSFRHPKQLQLVATGELVEERDEGEMHFSRRRSAVPLRLAGFNLGEYKVASASRGSLRVDVYANKAVESSLAPQRREVLLPAPPTSPVGRSQRQPPAPQPVLIQPPPPDPASQIDSLANEVAEAFEFLAARFGEPPLRTLAVSPIPGAFGQGFPGLIYLSTLSYLSPRERPQFATQSVQQLFFSEILVAHEVAHQWWGNTITTAGYRDEWIMEALANYSALLLLERKRGAKTLEGMLERYRDHLMEKGANGQPIESAGPLHLGARLETSETPEAYRAIVYEKGTWVIHMLRRRLGDAAFFRMLRELHTRFLRSRITTNDLRALAAAHQGKGMPDPDLDQLFASYVDGTGIPVLRLQARPKRTAKGGAIAIELEQAGVPAEFTVDVPIELDLGRGKTETRWVRTDGERTAVEWTLATTPVRAQIDPRYALLAVTR